jgi:hypothetical protein
MLGRFERLGPWLFCLFLIAQVGGVIPLVYVDELHEYGALGVTGALTTPDPYSQPRQHQPGTHNEHDQCCTLHHGMVGTLTNGSFQVVAPTIHAVFEQAWTAPVGEHPVRIDRPPKA